MGFGPLLIGYIITYIITIGIGEYLFAGMLIGGFIMFLGLSELRKYCPTFLYAIIANVLMILCSFYKTAAFMDSAFLLEIGIDTPILQAVFDIIKFVIDIVFNFTLLYGIADLSRRVEYSKTREKAIRNMLFVGIYAIFQIVMLIPNTIFQADKAFFMTLLMIFQLIYAFFNILLVFKCYAMICPEGEEEMKKKPSRFAFVNKMREKQDEREQRAIESTKAYLEKKKQDKEAKNNMKNDNHRKKKK